MIYIIPHLKKIIMPSFSEKDEFKISDSDVKGGKFEFPTLYKKDKMNRVTYSKISINDNQILVSRGIVGMKETSYPPTEAKAKNIGKKNATTPQEQAFIEAKSKWDAKVNKQGFTIEKSGEGCGDSGGAILPMLANKLTPKFDRYPCQVSPKIDGCRCVAALSDNNVRLFSRTKKEFNFMDTVRNHLKSLLDEVNLSSVDGELYSHTLPFTTITSIIRQKNKKSQYDHLMEYWIFDIPDGSGVTYNDRINTLKVAEKKYNKSFPRKADRVLRFVYSKTARSMNDIKKLHDSYVGEGYEGVMVRDSDSKYEFFRSKHLLKYKEFSDKEFKVVGATEGKGIDRGAIIFLCENEDGVTFSVRPRGTVGKRRWQFINKHLYIGKMLTVRYQDTGLGSGDMLPRFGVGIKFNEAITEAVDFRDYE